MSFVSFPALCTHLAAADVLTVLLMCSVCGLLSLEPGEPYMLRQKMSTLFTSCAEPELILLWMRCYYNETSLITFRPGILLCCEVWPCFVEGNGCDRPLLRWPGTDLENCQAHSRLTVTQNRTQGQIPELIVSKRSNKAFRVYKD